MGYEIEDYEQVRIDDEVYDALLEMMADYYDQEKESNLVNLGAESLERLTTIGKHNSPLVP